MSFNYQNYLSKKLRHLRRKINSFSTYTNTKKPTNQALRRRQYNLLRQGAEQQRWRVQNSGKSPPTRRYAADSTVWYGKAQQNNVGAFKTQAKARQLGTAPQTVQSGTARRSNNVGELLPYNAQPPA